MRRTEQAGRYFAQRKRTPSEFMGLQGPDTPLAVPCVITLCISRDGTHQTELLHYAQLAACAKHDGRRSIIVVYHPPLLSRYLSASRVPHKRHQKVKAHRNPARSGGASSGPRSLASRARGCREVPYRAPRQGESCTGLQKRARRFACQSARLKRALPWSSNARANPFALLRTSNRTSRCAAES